MATRLDRLLNLLETGSTPAIRQTAASQIGEIQKIHPYDLQNLLRRRIATELVAEVKKEEPTAPTTLMSFDTFNVTRVLDNGKKLLASGGEEFDINLDEMPLAERLAFQRAQLKQNLGMVGQFGGDDDDLISDEDLVMHTKLEQAKKEEEVKREAEVENTEGMSARQRNAAKRRAKKMAKDTTTKRGRGASASASAPAPKADESAPKKGRNMKTVVTDQPQSSDKVVLESVVDNEKAYEDTTVWPFQDITEDLCHDLFKYRFLSSPTHADPRQPQLGGVGLREIFKTHAKGAGKTVGATAEQLERQNRACLQDYALRLLCVFALDRFGDYISDQMTAPVRETCAQALGALLKHMNAEDVRRVLDIILMFTQREEWQVRHGGMLGLKDLAELILPQVLPAIIRGLQDLDDDVRSISAGSLLPIAEATARLQPQLMPDILTILWDTLTDLDDLSASTTSIMNLLAEFYSFPSVLELSLGQVLQSSAHPLATLVPRLWPFLRHTIASVRLSALKTFEKLLSMGAQTVRLWLPPILPEALSNVFRNFMLEEKADIIEKSHTVWNLVVAIAQGPAVRQAAHRSLTTWFSALHGSPYPTAAGSSSSSGLSSSTGSAPAKGRRGRPRKQDVEADDPPATGAGRGKRKRGKAAAAGPSSPQTAASEGPATKKRGVAQAEPDDASPSDLSSSSAALGRPVDDGEASEASARMRIAGAKALGALARAWPAENLDELYSVLLSQISSRSAAQQMAASLVLTEWGYLVHPALPPCQPFPAHMSEALNSRLSSEEEYSEIESHRTKLYAECSVLIQSLVSVGIPVGSDLLPITEQQCVHKEVALQLATDVFDACFGQLAALEASVKTQLQARRKRVLTCLAQYDEEETRLRVTVASCIASAVVALEALPDKLNALIHALMNAVQKETSAVFQRRTGHALAHLLRLCSVRTPCPNPRIIKNLCTYLCTIRPKGLWAAEDSEEAGRERKAKEETEGSDAARAQAAAEEQENLVKSRGATFALVACAEYFQETLFQGLPWLWELMCLPLKQVHDTTDPSQAASFDVLKDNAEVSGSLMDALQVTATVVPHLHSALYPKVIDELLPLVFYFVTYPHSGVRTCLAKCLATICKTITHPAMRQVVGRLLPMLADVENVDSRLGATEALHSIISTIGSEILPYIVFLVVPILGRMSDFNERIRKVVTYCFATLIKLMPLESAVSTVDKNLLADGASAIPDPPDLPKEMVEQKQRERRFLEQLLDGSKLDNYALPIKINAELRKYQQEGVNWLGFLNKYQLHGILCDDMGLGKTLQAICIIASDDFHRREQFERTRSPEFAPVPSLVVCPPTLSAHWHQEILKFCENRLRPLQYYGKPQDRKRMQEQMREYDVVIMSYDILRNDIDQLKAFTFNYCVLDEGHIIKSGKTKITQAVKQIQANHRVILSGTPVQNNVLELWSLFDFLMPGFLGTERQFQQMYSKPILASKDPKQVLPFLLRRVKEDVRLYEDFSKTQVKQGIASSIATMASEEAAAAKATAESKGKTTHIFQALQYLRKLCSHPALVLNDQHPEYEAIKKEYGLESLRSLESAPKLQSLKQLLNECGIGIPQVEKAEDATEPIVSNHRVLIFAQLKSMLDIIETDLLKAHMPNVSYLRLDGMVAAQQRQNVVSKFNADPTIDILLLTTHVGGLGLNLTGADTVIFVEHDWNPMKDLQAMDRAHRIGQKKTVNVYRLITRATLEEKIMGLQKFKMNIANSIVNSDNASIRTMDTNQLLDLFNFSAEQAGTLPGLEQTSGKGDEGVKKAGGALSKVLEGLEELWDESQYNEEYNLDSFLERMQ
ncbi:SNF2 family Nterminal domain containing protein [Acanthamoeba castellanii str. Neff]|uniref:SNF2 family Nterminal domain containing protein n=1 Tax=Acanthamoeba castellanii (strain ATCC 30010 / Neff) TaxID=1257118 RepID=L8H2Z3_ACACF|nr:SNF2 family Nterminal domain containing protein [Acanthamoeba castellanii str. Neff]ELR19914.1 SNF2 family Nterminal domain containing protein [Acanthamoeba castellanii str. Neff]